MYKEITIANIELTDKCNSKCPQCHRTDAQNGCKPYSWIQNIEWSLEDFKKAFPKPNLKTFYFCGTYGDPLMCSDLYEIVKYIMENSNSQVMLSTNGSVRDEISNRYMSEIIRSSDIDSTLIQNNSKGF